MALNVSSDVEHFTLHSRLQESILYLTRTFVVEMLYNYHLLCYVREMLDTSTATFTMSLVLSFVYLHVHALNAHQKSAS